MSNSSKNLTGPSGMLIFHGAGNMYEVPGDQIAPSGGTTLEVLRDIAANHIRDPELIATLNSQQVVIQTFSESSGSTHQRTVAPTEQFSKLIEAVENETLEVGVSQYHEGGHTV